jgi:hypothetical protein
MNNYNLILKGNNEFYKDTNNKTYYIMKANTKEIQIIMINNINKFIDNQIKNNSENHYIGIDFEFEQVSKEKKNIALMQINLENDSNDAYIYIFKPDTLAKEQLDIIIKLLTNPRIYKILHGSESLDIPYIFNQLLVTHENINLFCSNFYDTKFLCEYYNICNKVDYLCGIYSLLENHKIIDNSHIIKLNKIEEEMGEIQYIDIDINNMDDNLLKYALYDVIFLPQLIKKLISYGHIYQYIIPEILHIIFKSKRLIEIEFNKLTEEINMQNNYYIMTNNIRFSLSEVYTLSLYQYFTFDKLIEINYFKHFFLIITKLIIYSNLKKYDNIFIKKDILLNNFDYNKYYTWLSQYKSLFDFIKQSEFEFIKNELQ